MCLVWIYISKHKFKSHRNAKLTFTVHRCFMYTPSVVSASKLKVWRFFRGRGFSGDGRTSWTSANALFTKWTLVSHIPMNIHVCEAYREFHDPRVHLLNNFISHIHLLHVLPGDMSQRGMEGNQTPVWPKHSHILFRQRHFRAETEKVPHLLDIQYRRRAGLFREKRTDPTLKCNKHHFL